MPLKKSTLKRIQRATGYSESRAKEVVKNVRSKPTKLGRATSKAKKVLRAFNKKYK